MTEIDTVESYRRRLYASPGIPRPQGREQRPAPARQGLHTPAPDPRLPRVGPYKTLKNYKDGDWNAIEVIVTGTKAHCTCNGELLEAALEIPAQGPSPCSPKPT